MRRSSKTWDQHMMLPFRDPNLLSSNAQQNPVFWVWTVYSFWYDNLVNQPNSPGCFGILAFLKGAILINWGGKTTTTPAPFPPKNKAYFLNKNGMPGVHFTGGKGNSKRRILGVSSADFLALRFGGLEPSMHTLYASITGGGREKAHGFSSWWNLLEIEGWSGRGFVGHQVKNMWMMVIYGKKGRLYDGYNENHESRWESNVYQPIA